MAENDPRVSIEQSLRSAGHTSVAAHQPYMHVDERSEAEMIDALWIVLLQKEDTDKKPSAKEEWADGAI